MAILGFLSEELQARFSPLKDFWHLGEHDIPSTPGAYILVAGASIRFPYPVGRSPIFYVGQSRSLASRLRLHLKFSMQARQEDRPLPLYWARYEYAAAFGGRYCYVQTGRGMTPKALEDMLMALFAKKYRSFPVANSAGAWRRVHKVFTQGDV